MPVDQMLMRRLDRIRNTKQPSTNNLLSEYVSNIYVLDEINAQEENMSSRKFANRTFANVANSQLSLTHN